MAKTVSVANTIHTIFRIHHIFCLFFVHKKEKIKPNIEHNFFVSTFSFYIQHQRSGLLLLSSSHQRHQQQRQRQWHQRHQLQSGLPLLSSFFFRALLSFPEKEVCAPANHRVTQCCQYLLNLFNFAKDRMEGVARKQQDPQEIVKNKKHCQFWLKLCLVFHLPPLWMMAIKVQSV